MRTSNLNRLVGSQSFISGLDQERIVDSKK
jgi:hypothetical protein